MADDVKKEDVKAPETTDIISGTDVPPPQQPPVDLPPEGSPNRLDIKVDMATATAMKVQEFDKQIADAEFVVYDLKKQKANYIYESNVQGLIKQAQDRQKQAQPQK